LIGIFTDKLFNQVFFTVKIASYCALNFSPLWFISFSDLIDKLRTQVIFVFVVFIHAILNLLVDLLAQYLLLFKDSFGKFLLDLLDDASVLFVKLNSL